jgi:hypothetical protein
MFAAALRHPSISIEPVVDPQRGSSEKIVVPANKRARTRALDHKAVNADCHVSSIPPRAYKDVLPLSDALQARIRVFLGQGPNSNGQWPSETSAVCNIAGCENGETGVRVVWSAEPQCANY